MENKNKKPLIFIALLFSVFLIVGGTIAYYTSSDTFNNEFDTGTYKIETQEAFVSPDNWTPGTTTPKTVIATNKGNTPAAVRIKLTPSWEDKDGNPLPLSDGTNEAAIINFASNLNSKWTYDNGYYYYKKALNENESTTSLLKSVTFNPNVSFDETKDCDTVNGVTTCTTTFNDYAGGKYTLQIEVETAQFDKYKEIWGTDVNLKAPIQRDKVLMTNLYDYDDEIHQTFGKDIDRDSFESIVIVDNVNIPNDAINSWDCSEAQNESVMCWYTNVNAEDEDEYSTYYELYIGQEGGVVANPNSSWAFSFFSSVKYLDLSYLDTSIVTDMSYMFDNNGYGESTWNISGLSNFDTSNVTNMKNMFSYSGYYATTFELDLSGWDISRVTNMSYMFSSAGFRSTTWNIGDISNWDTSQVTDMSGVFQGAGHNATTWNIGNLSGWDTSKVTNMYEMFSGAGYKSTTWSVGDLGGWDTSNVTDMSFMFSSAGYNSQTFNIGNIGSWDISKATNIASMFLSAGYNSTTIDLDLSGWDTSSVRYTSFMFSHAGYNSTTINLDLSGWDTSSVINMEAMFNSAGYNATTIDLNLGDWDTSNVTTMRNMFNYAGRNATTWNIMGTLNVYNANINQLFDNCKSAKATLNIYGNPTSYSGAFLNAATTTGSGITVNYSSATTNINAIIATKSSNSNVVKGSQLD